jgi:nanoRNase/pAp phosphatase (c-di-AMP/oligoRNAs hydrolase)
MAHRLVTRSDFDGLVCAVLLRELGLVEDILFVHPKDMQDGKIPISDNDITTNLPYVPGVHLAFDHHLSETIRVEGKPANHIIDPNAPSASRVVFDYYGGKDRFGKISADMMAAVDKADSGQLTMDDVLEPEGWMLMNFLMDARTGLGRFREFRISNYQLMMQLIDLCLTMSVEEILETPDVKERVELYWEHDDPARMQIKRCATVHNKLVVLDLRNDEVIYATNRFMVYALYPQCDLSIHVMWGLKKQNTVFAMGKSIFDRGSKINVGEMCLSYGGGGHAAAGTCQIENDKADDTLKEIIGKIG